MKSRITITKKRNGRFYLGLSKLHAQELLHTVRREQCGLDGGAFAARYEVAEALRKLETLLLQEPPTP